MTDGERSGFHYPPNYSFHAGARLGQLFPAAREIAVIAVMDQIKKAAVTRAQVWPRGPEVSESWQWDIIMPRLKEFQMITPRMALVPKLL
jgi:hypothetical protein